MSADGRGVVSNAGCRLLADLAGSRAFAWLLVITGAAGLLASWYATGLTTAFTDALRRLRPRGTGHAPGGSRSTWR